MPQILVVDDDEDVVGTVTRSLKRQGHRIVPAYNGKEALQAIQRHHPDLVVLDIMMPGMDGIQVCRRLRNDPRTSNIPILFLTARGRLEDKIEGFEAGADDYLTKPFELQELELRVAALLRRAKLAQEGGAPRPLRVGGLSLDERTFEVTVEDRGETILLTPVEFELLHYLMSHAEEVIPSERLLQEVWGYPPGTGAPDLVRVHIKNLRDKIEPIPSDPTYIRTISRHGYTVQTNSESSR